MGTEGEEVVVFRKEDGEVEGSYGLCSSNIHHHCTSWSSFGHGTSWSFHWVRKKKKRILLSNVAWALKSVAFNRTQNLFLVRNKEKERAWSCKIQTQRDHSSFWTQTWRGLAALIPLVVWCQSALLQVSIIIPLLCSLFNWCTHNSKIRTCPCVSVCVCFFFFPCLSTFFKFVIHHLLNFQKLSWFNFPLCVFAFLFFNFM